MWVKTSETRVGIAVNLPGDMPIFDLARRTKISNLRLSIFTAAPRAPKSSESFVSIPPTSRFLRIFAAVWLRL